MADDGVYATWWMIYQMRLQYPVDLVIKADMDIASLMSEGVADSHIHYCPLGRHQGNLEGPRVTEESRVPSRGMGRRKVVRR